MSILEENYSNRGGEKVAIQLFGIFNQYNKEEADQAWLTEPMEEKDGWRRLGERWKKSMKPKDDTKSETKSKKEK